MPDGSNLVIGRANTGTSTTSLTRSGGRPVTALSVNNEWAIAISAASRGPAVSADGGPGILGHSTDDVGVMGASDRDVGLLGTSDGQGPAVFGRASGSAGIVGATTTNRSAGVVGSATGDSAGVWGRTASASWPGVEGFATGTNHGVRGVSVGPASPSSVGVVGYSTNGTGVFGIANSPGPSSWGGAFIGGLMVVGGPKSAAVPHPDGSYRTLYCIESPESWFEDFGRAKLVRGRARVKLDRNFAAVVRTNDYHVFLSPEGETRGLYVSQRSSAGFEVREHEAGKNGTKFSYRIVARRKDIEAPRFAKITKPPFDGRDLKKISQGIDLRKFEKRMKAARPSSGRV